ncbi:hypothetical protein CTheo_9241 [Ceratobasidium theobromae]|uniref:Uncharacterized protein n=1 Tax=Ceratobasidium theobromae TaxID=1582974 RepID=A0A5N5Q5J8_9AGAM|nr:hypothetical protein CTheo_9241 [Ceratobasidium theobromae]
MFLERGPGIESLVDLLHQYLMGDYSKKAVLAKWLDDLVDAAELAANSPDMKRVSKPSAALKCSHEYLEEEAEKTASHKHTKEATADREDVMA